MSLEPNRAFVLYNNICGEECKKVTSPYFTLKESENKGEFTLSRSSSPSHEITINGMVQSDPAFKVRLGDVIKWDGTLFVLFPKNFTGSPSGAGVSGSFNFVEKFISGIKGIIPLDDVISLAMKLDYLEINNEPPSVLGCEPFLGKLPELIVSNLVGPFDPLKFRLVKEDNCVNDDDYDDDDDDTDIVDDANIDDDDDDEDTDIVDGANIDDDDADIDIFIDDNPEAGLEYIADNSPANGGVSRISLNPTSISGAPVRTNPIINGSRVAEGPGNSNDENGYEQPEQSDNEASFAAELHEPAMSSSSSPVDSFSRIPSQTSSLDPLLTDGMMGNPNPVQGSRENQPPLPHQKRNRESSGSPSTPTAAGFLPHKVQKH